MLLINARTDSPLATSVELAQTGRERRRGLLGRDGLPGGSALIITRCNAVHTVGMRFAIDVAFVDSRGCVLKVIENLVPWRIAVSPLASAVIECPAGALHDALRVGDSLYISTEDGVARRFQGRFNRATVAPRWAAVSSRNSTTSG
jgi:uncharacterized membrane protein (UPF0127 family)